MIPPESHRVEYKRQLSGGLTRILQAYEPECVKFSTHFTRISFPCQVQAESQPDVQTRSEKSSEKILQMLAESPQLTIADLAQEVGIGTRAIEKQLAKLQEAGRLSRIGGRKEGYWQVTGRREK